MTTRSKRPQGTHNPSQKTLQRWDTEGGAPKGGRAKRPRDPAQLHVRMSPDELNSLDAWIKTQPSPRPTRPVAIQRIVKESLARSVRNKKSAATAREMAGEQLDRLSDRTVSDDERASRKRRLLKGPKEFREMRGNLPKPKE